MGNERLRKDVSSSTHRFAGLKLWQATVLIFLLGLTLRGAVLGLNHPIIVGGDEPEFVALGETLATEWRFVTSRYWHVVFQGGKPGDVTASRSPVLPFFLALHFKVFGNSLLFPRITLIIIASLISVVLVWMGMLLGMELAGLIAGFLWSVWPPSILSYYSSDRIYTEGLGTFFLVTGIALVLSHYRNNQLKEAIAAGAFLGLSALTRGYTVFVIPIVVLLLMVRPTARGWRTVLVLTLSSVLVVGAWILRNWIALGRPVLSTQTEHFYLGNNLWARGSYEGDINTKGFDAPQLRVVKERNPNVMAMTELERSDMWTREGVAVVRSNPGHFVWLLWRKTLIFWGPFQSWSAGWYRWHYAWAAALALAFVGSWRALKMRLVVPVLLLWAAPLGVFFASLITYSFDRYRFVAEPFIIFLGSVGLVMLLLDRGLNYTNEAKRTVEPSL